MKRAVRVPAWVTVMEDRQPDFFHGYAGYEPDAPAPLNRHGPNTHAWTQADLKRLVDAFHGHGVEVLLGYWVHECDFVLADHPELFIRGADGQLWNDPEGRSSDFSPLRRMQADPARGIEPGERYAEWSVRQYARLARDFGFDGLFLGDGAMGFRHHGRDWKDLRHFDYHEDWLAEFRVDVGFATHEGCALHDDDRTTAEKAADVHAHHWDHWVAWNTDRWTDYYRTMAEGVHATGGKLAAYNCMNFDPALARLHGVDYRAIAEAGLDILVFQAYDYAWGPLGPFGVLHMKRKDIDTNLAALLRTRAHVGYDTGMRIVVTVETEDEVETWDSPASHTVGEAYAYGVAAGFDGRHWRRAADGAFIVWGNSVPHHEWEQLRAVFAQLSQPPAEPEAAMLWRETEPLSLARLGVPTAVEPDLLYAHLDVVETVGEGHAGSAIITERLAEVAPLSTSHPRAGRAAASARAPRRGPGQ